MIFSNAFSRFPIPPFSYPDTLYVPQSSTCLLHHAHFFLLMLFLDLLSYMYIEFIIAVITFASFHMVFKLSKRNLGQVHTFWKLMKLV